MIIEWEAEDAATHEDRQMYATPDRHGIVIGVKNSLPSVILDLSGGKLRVFEADENGDVPEDPKLIIDL